MKASTVDIPAVGRRNIFKLETWVMLIGGVIAAILAYWAGQSAAFSLRSAVMQQFQPRPQQAGSSKVDNNMAPRAEVMFQ
jgi:hypothetical protein